MGNEFHTYRAALDAAVTDWSLPPLPEPRDVGRIDEHFEEVTLGYDAEQMHTYARTVQAAERALLNDELERFRNGYQGSCYACEPVGVLNQKLKAELAKHVAPTAEPDGDMLDLTPVGPGRTVNDWQTDRAEPVAWRVKHTDNKGRVTYTASLTGPSPLFSDAFEFTPGYDHPPTLSEEFIGTSFKKGVFMPGDVAAEPAALTNVCPICGGTAHQQWRCSACKTVYVDTTIAAVSEPVASEPLVPLDDSAVLLPGHKDDPYALPVPKAETDGVQLFMLGMRGRVPYPMGLAVSVINAAAVAYPPAPITAEPVASEAWIQEALRLAKEWGQFAGSVEFDEGIAEDEWAAFEAHLRSKG